MQNLLKEIKENYSEVWGEILKLEYDKRFKDSSVVGFEDFYGNPNIEFTHFNELDLLQFFELKDIRLNQIWKEEKQRYFCYLTYDNGRTEPIGDALIIKAVHHAGILRACELYNKQLKGE